MHVELIAITATALEPVTSRVGSRRSNELTMEIRFMTPARSRGPQNLVMRLGISARDELQKQCRRNGWLYVKLKR